MTTYSATSLVEIADELERREALGQLKTAHAAYLDAAALVRNTTLNDPERATLLATNAALVKALEWYADAFCEFSPGNTGCGKYGDDICSGCRARAALLASEKV